MPFLIGGRWIFSKAVITKHNQLQILA